MKNIILVFLVLFTLKTQAQNKEVIAKMQALSAKMQKSQSNTGGKITYTVNGKTYTETVGIGTVIINGQIGDISSDNHTVSIGDGQPHAFKKGESYVCKVIMVKVDGLQYARRSKDNMATITFYDGKSIKGTFSGTVYNEKTKKTLAVSGTFETGNITVI
jgi:hypothetical protein